MKKLLIADSNLIRLKEICVQLIDTYAVIPAQSGKQALTVIRKEMPDLILLNVAMSEIDGFEIMRSLKEEPPLAEIPVIFLTEHHDTAIELRGFESGAVDVITEPMEKSILLNRIQLHLQYASYKQSLEQTIKELRNSIILSFADLIECRDHNSGGHVLRTGTYTRLLGQELLKRGTFGEELSQEKLGYIVVGTYFHDIGKLGIRDKLLLKRTGLTREEFKNTQNHTTIGARVLQHIHTMVPEQESFAYAAEIALSHHERYDGTGYPQGLAAEEIPLGVRIMTVANVYDACTSDRVYRKGKSHEETCAIINNGKGTEFDPRVVDAFENISGQFLYLALNQAALTNIDWGVL